MNNKIRFYSSILAIAIFFALLIVPPVNRSAIAQQSNGSSSNVPLCVLYTALQEPGRRTQLVALSLTDQKSYVLGGLVNAEIRGLAVDPSTGILYAASDMVDEVAGQLYRVDRTTGVLETVGPHGYAVITELAFRWAGPGNEATLWGWAKEVGLVRMNTQTGAASLELASAEKVAGLSWSEDGSTLYASSKNVLWKYQDGYSRLERVTNTLPKDTAAIEMRSDGLLVGINGQVSATTARETQPLEQARVFIYDPADGRIVYETAIPSGRHYPSFSGLAWPGACGNASKGGPADIIKAVTVEPTEACPGVDFLVTVQVAHPETAQGQVDVAVNGNWGDTQQYVQFEGAPGERQIIVNASTPEGFTDMEQAAVTIKDDCAAQQFLDVAVTPNLYQEYTVDFEVLNGEDFEGQSPHYLWDFGDGASAQSDVPYASHNYASAADKDQLNTVFDAVVTLQRDGLEPLVAHRSITLWNTYAALKQKGTIQPPVEADPRLKRADGGWTGNYKITNLEMEDLIILQPTLVFKSCDMAQPPVEMDWDAPFSIGAGAEYANQLVVEDEYVTNNLCEVELRLAGQTALSKQPVEMSVYFQANLNAQFAQTVTDEPTLATLNEIAGSGKVTDPDYITDEDLEQLKLEGEVSPNALPGPQAVTAPPPAAQLELFADAIRQDTSGAEVQPEASIASEEDCDGNPETPNPIGCECTPGEVRPADQPQDVGMLTCTATSEWKRFAAHLPNAQKGDIILSPGCSGLIGMLLLQVSPPQFYAHTGMMTSDYYQITHSTSSEERYMAHRVGWPFGQDGIDENVLKYGWPGVVTQSVDGAFRGEVMTDSYGNSYTISGFTIIPAKCPGPTQLAYPLVVKPPAAQAQSVRPLLEAAADIALATQGNAHYRFFAYTDGAISFDQTRNAPENLAWLPGSSATVCSQFVWSSLKRVDMNGDGVSDIQLEGSAIEESDVRAGAEWGLNGNTYDGLYFYREDERKQGAEWLHGQVYNQAYELAGAWWNFWFQIANKYANQTTNCFINDDCASNNTSTAWQNPGSGTAVSPQDILFWDAPGAKPGSGGVYGHSERMVYRSGGYGRVYRWAEASGSEMVRGRVYYMNGTVETPVPGATVKLSAAGILETQTNADGNYRFRAVPVGTYEIEASAWIDPDPSNNTTDDVVYYSSTVCPNGQCIKETVNVQAGQVNVKDLKLHPPSVPPRTVVVTNSPNTKLGEWAWKYTWYSDPWLFFCGNPIQSLWVKFTDYSCTVSADQPVADKNWLACAGSRCIPMDMHCELQPDLETIQVEYRSPGIYNSQRDPALKFLLAPGDVMYLDDKVYENKSGWCTTAKVEFWLKFENKP